VSAFGKAFDWTKSLPLFGKCVIVTRPRSQQSRLSPPLRDLGAEVLEAPAIKIIPRLQGGVAGAAAAVMDALNAAASAKFIIFTSANGVECFINAIRENKMDIRRFANAKIAVIGAGTEKMLSSFALSADYMPEVYDARHLAEGVAGLCEPGDKVVSFRAAEGSPAINEALDKKGIELLDIPVYDTVPHDGCHLLIKPYAGYCLDAGRELIVALTSASTARSSAAALCEYTGNPLVQAVCIGEMTALAAREMGFINIHVASEATIDSMIEIITSLAAAKGETADNGY
jgi:uroporphyrinogen III methyltransferase/synthase